MQAQGTSNKKITPLTVEFSLATFKATPGEWIAKVIQIDALRKNVYTKFLEEFTTKLLPVLQQLSLTGRIKAPHQFFSPYQLLYQFLTEHVDLYRRHYPEDADIETEWEAFKHVLAQHRYEVKYASQSTFLPFEKIKERLQQTGIFTEIDIQHLTWLGNLLNNPNFSDIQLATACEETLQSPNPFLLNAKQSGGHIVRLPKSVCSIFQAFRISLDQLERDSQWFLEVLTREEERLSSADVAIGQSVQRAILGMTGMHVPLSSIKKRWRIGAQKAYPGFSFDFDEGKKRIEELFSLCKGLKATPPTDYQALQNGKKKLVSYLKFFEYFCLIGDIYSKIHPLVTAEIIRISKAIPSDLSQTERLPYDLELYEGFKKYGISLHIMEMEFFAEMMKTYSNLARNFDFFIYTSATKLDFLLESTVISAKLLVDKFGKDKESLETYLDSSTPFPVIKRGPHLPRIHVVLALEKQGEEAPLESVSNKKSRRKSPASVTQSKQDKTSVQTAANSSPSSNLVVSAAISSTITVIDVTSVKPAVGPPAKYPAVSALVSSTISVEASTTVKCPVHPTESLQKSLGILTGLLRERCTIEQKKHLLNCRWHVEHVVILWDIFKQKGEKAGRLNILTALTGSMAWSLETLMRSLIPTQIFKDDTPPIHDLEKLYFHLKPRDFLPYIISELQFNNYWCRYFHEEFECYRLYQTLTTPIPDILKQFIALAHNPKAISQSQFSQTVERLMQNYSALFLELLPSETKPGEILPEGLSLAPYKISAIPSQKILKDIFVVFLKEYSLPKTHPIVLLIKQSHDSLQMLDNTIEMLNASTTTREYSLWLNRSLFLLQESLERTLQSLIYLKLNTVLRNCHELETLISHADLHGSKHVVSLAAAFRMNNKTRYPAGTSSLGVVAQLIDQVESIRQNPDKLEGWRQASSKEMWELPQEVKLDEIHASLAHLLDLAQTGFLSELLPTLRERLAKSFS